MKCSTVVMALVPVLGALLGELNRLGRQTRFDHLPEDLQPFRPYTIQTLNGLGIALQAIGVEAVSLDRRAIMTAACSAARHVPAPNKGSSKEGVVGKCDFDAEEGFLPALDALLKSLENDARLSFLGRVVAKGQVTAVLKNRLEQIHYSREHPEIDAEKIVRPVFIAGLPRTGTTFLHNLLTQDTARFRSPLHWEYIDANPRVADRRDAGADIARAEHLQDIERMLDQFKKLSPSFDSFHPLAATRPEEDVVPMASEADSLQFEATFNVTSYMEHILGEDDHARVMQWHHKVLKQLQYTGKKSGLHQGAPTWLLKTPYYLGLLLDIAREYKDAIIIQTHRAPLKVLASSASVHARTFGIVSDHVDLVAIGEYQTKLYTRMLQMNLAHREALDAAAAAAAGEATASGRNQNIGVTFVDLHLADLKADPVGSVAKIYHAIGVELSDSHRGVLRAWLDENRVDKYGTHKYEPADFGITQATMSTNPTFAEYCSRFEVQGC